MSKATAHEWLFQLHHYGVTKIPAARWSHVAMLGGGFLFIVCGAGMLYAVPDGGVVFFILLVAMGIGFIISGIKRLRNPPHLMVHSSGVTIEGGKAEPFTLPWHSIFEAAQWEIQDQTGVILSVTPELQERYLATKGPAFRKMLQLGTRATGYRYGVAIPHGLVGGERALVDFLNAARMRCGPPRHITAQPPSEHPRG